MADSAAPVPAPSAREKPAFDKSMSARSSFKKKFVSAHAVLPFDQPMLIYHGGSIAVWLLLAFVLPLMRWMADDDRGFHSAFVWAMACLIVALFYVYLLINPPERVELYSNRIVVRLHREGKFLIPLKDVAGVEQVDNPFKTFCQPAFMHTRATQMSSSVYIQSKSKVSPMGMVLTVENSEQFVKDLKTLLGASLTTNPAAEDEEEDDELDYAGLPS